MDPGLRTSVDSRLIIARVFDGSRLFSKVCLEQSFLTLKSFDIGS